MCLLTFKYQATFLNDINQTLRFNTYRNLSTSILNIPSIHQYILSHEDSRMVQKALRQTRSGGFSSVFHILTKASGSKEDATHCISITFPGNPDNDAASHNAEQSSAHPQPMVLPDADGIHSAGGDPPPGSHSARPRCLFASPATVPSSKVAASFLLTFY